MARNKEAQRNRIRRRNDLIRAQYDVLHAERHSSTGARKHTYEHILLLLSTKFHLSEHAIADVLNMRFEKQWDAEENKPNNQATLF